jgi:hypothetical protein
MLFTKREKDLQSLQQKVQSSLDKLKSLDFANHEKTASVIQDILKTLDTKPVIYIHLFLFIH